ncbi:MAG: glycosyltransferase family A protein [Planctomycetaceae bacterium]|nr:glycosyltransferase family A protein [Planctomycetaceae bacterium]
MNPTFSVVIPIYNRSEFLAETLASVHAQTISPVEILVVDDGSGDKEAKIISPIVDEAGAKLIQQANAGAGVARNRGTQEAVGSYLVFLDSDDLMVPTAISTYTEIINNNHASLLAACVIEFSQDSSSSREIVSDIKMNRYADYLASSRNSEVTLGAGMMVVRKDLFLESSGFTKETINAEDHDMAMRLATAPVFVQIISPTTLMYRRHTNSLTA